MSTLLLPSTLQALASQPGVYHAVHAILVQVTVPGDRDQGLHDSLHLRPFLLARLVRPYLSVFPQQAPGQADVRTVCFIGVVQLASLVPAPIVGTQHLAGLTAEPVGDFGVGVQEGGFDIDAVDAGYSGLTSMEYPTGPLIQPPSVERQWLPQS